MRRGAAAEAGAPHQMQQQLRQRAKQVPPPHLDDGVEQDLASSMELRRQHQRLVASSKLLNQLKGAPLHMQSREQVEELIDNIRSINVHQ